MKLRQKHFRYWVAVVLVVATLSMAGMALVRSVGTVGDRFAGFFFGPNLLVSVSQRADWPGIDQGLRPLERIQAVDGLPLKTGADLLFQVSLAEPGDLLTYEVVKEGTVREVTVPVTRYSYTDFIIGFLGPFLMGLLFVAFGAIFYFSQPSARGSLVFLTFCCVVATYCTVAFEAYTTFYLFRATLIYPLIGALSVHLFSLFPEAPSFRRSRIFALSTFYLAAIVLAISRQVALGNSAQSEVLSRLSALFVFTVIVADLALVVRAYRRSESQPDRDKMKVIGMGLILGTFFLAVWALNFLLNDEPFYLDEGMLLASFFPLFMGYAILRQNIFRLDRVIRLSLSYGVAAAIILVIYLGMVGAIRGIIPPGVADRHFGWLFVIFVGFGAFLFNILRLRINDMVKRWLFRSQYDLTAAVNELSQSLTGEMNVDDLVQRVGTRLVEVLDLERAAIVILAESPTVRGGVETFRWLRPPPFGRWLPIFRSEGLLAWMKSHPQPREVTDIEEKNRPSFSQSTGRLLSSRVEVVIPCVSSGKILGMILLGSRRSGHRFERGDLNLLAPLGTQMGLVWENVELAAEAAKQARLAAIGQMASVLIHDIKNPLSTIKISAGSIKRRFREGDHCFELATYVEEEVDRMNRTVQEILVYAKPGNLVLKHWSVLEIVGDIVNRLQPSFQGAGIQLKLEASCENQVLTVDRDRLARALENLLVNAQEATEKGGSVTVRVMASEGGDQQSRVTIAVEDTGSGIDPSTREQMFTAFFTTKPSGTGLGLAIVRQIVDEHGGDVEVLSEAGQGTRFMMHLPVGVNSN